MAQIAALQAQIASLGSRVTALEPPPPLPERLASFGYLPQGGIGLIVVDATTGATISTAAADWQQAPELNWPAGGRRHLLTRSYMDASKLYIWNYSDMSSAAILQPGGNTYSVVASKDGAKFYAGNDAGIVVIDDATLRVTQTISLGGATPYEVTQGTDGNVYAMVFDPNTGQISIMRVDPVAGAVTGSWPGAVFGKLVASGGFVAQSAYGTGVQVLNTADGTWAPYAGVSGTNGFETYLAPGQTAGTFAAFGEDYDGSFISWRLNKINAAAQTATQIDADPTENLYNIAYSLTRDAIYLIGGNGITLFNLATGAKTPAGNTNAGMMVVVPGGPQ
jgi:hypothetical protein